MTAHSDFVYKIAHTTKRYLVVCPYDHLVDRITNATVLPIHHIHGDAIYECLIFTEIKKLRKWLLTNEPDKK